MPQHDDEQLGSHGPEPEEIDTSAGYELSDVRVTGIVVFLTALAIFVAVTGILCYGIGKVINAQMKKEDGPNSKWTKTAEVRELGNMPSSPRVAEQDGGADAAVSHAARPNRRRQPGRSRPACAGRPAAGELHARGGKAGHGADSDRAGDGTDCAARIAGGVRPAQEAPLMAGDQVPAIQEPLTNGFARTAYELDVEAARAAEAQRPE